MGNKLITQGKQTVIQARSALSSEQVAFAEWLALPPSKRTPRHQKDLCKELGVTEQSLCNWKGIPELWLVRDEVMGIKGRELVAKAQGVMEDAMDSPNHKVKLEAARDILDRFGESRKQEHIIETIQDLWNRYH